VTRGAAMLLSVTLKPPAGQGALRRHQWSGEFDDEFPGFTRTPPSTLGAVVTANARPISDKAFGLYQGERWLCRFKVGLRPQSRWPSIQHVQSPMLPVF
jgi:hypothetical protein